MLLITPYRIIYVMSRGALDHLLKVRIFWRRDVHLLGPIQFSWLLFQLPAPQYDCEAILKGRTPVPERRLQTETSTLTQSAVR